MAAMPAEGASASGPGPFLELAGNVMKGMSLLGEGLQKAGAPEEALSKLSDLMGGFEAFMSSLSGGGEAPEGEPMPQKGGASPIQDSQGRPQSPAGV